MSQFGMKQMRILYIEDNPLNMRLVGKNVRHMGYVMLEAVDAESGIQMVLKEKPDAILMDIHLPGMSGLDAVKLIKQNPEINKIPIIALTADTLSDTREACLKVGCDAYLTKPVRGAHLLRVLAQFLKQY
jgi:two-component system, cell cycle response regulator DivK